MKKDNIIRFDPERWNLKKAKAFVYDIEKFFENKEKAISVLLGALKNADDLLKRDIILLLGGVARKQIAQPLYEIMTDAAESEEIRKTAAVQLSVTVPLLKNPQPIAEALLRDIKSEDSVLRSNAAFALGWKGNTQAVQPLINLLFDRKKDVQQAAVNALSNLDDDRIFAMLVERLENGPLEQKRCILYNLWRFQSKRKEVIGVYMNQLSLRKNVLRFDALLLLGSMVDSEEYFSTYHGLLADASSRIRIFALEKLGSVEKEKLSIIRDDIEKLCEDPEIKVQRAAKKLTDKLR